MSTGYPCIFLFFSTSQKYRLASIRWPSLINLMRHSHCKGLVTLDENIAYLTNNCLHERKMNCSWPYEHAQDFTNVKYNWMRSLRWSVSSIKNDEFNTREEIKQHSLQREHESPHFLTAQKVTWDVWIYYFILIHFYIFSSVKCVCILNNSEKRTVSYTFFQIWISVLKKISILK